MLFAAAMLFGIAVVLGTAWLARPPRSDDGEEVAQDRGPRLVEPKGMKELCELLAQCRSVYLQLTGEHRGPGWTDRTPIDGAVAALQDPEQVRTLCDALAQVKDGPVDEQQLRQMVRVQQVAELRFVLRDGRQVAARLLAVVATTLNGRVRPSRAVVCGTRMLMLEEDRAQDGVLGRLLSRLQTDADANLRRFDARADSFAELAALPADQRAVTCASLDPAKAAQLVGHVELQRLTLSGPDPAAFAVLAALPRLRELSLDVVGLDEAAEALAKLSSLRSLELSPPWRKGEVGRIEPPDLLAWPESLAKLTQVESLRLHCRVDAAQLRAIATLPRLRELWFVTDALGADTVGALRSMPQLRKLAVAAVGKGQETLDGDELVRSLASTRIERLAFAGMKVGARSLATLAGVAPLRELDLGNVELDDEGCAALAGCKQLWRLTASYRMTQPRLDALRAALVGCTVLGDANMTFASYGGIAPPSWSHEWSADAQDPEPVQPKDLAELRKLLANVNKVTLIATPRNAGVPVLKDLPLLSTLFTNLAATGTPTGELPAPLIATARDDVQAWTKALLAGDAPPAAASIGPQDLKLELQLADGRVLVGAAEGYAGRTGELVMFGGVHVVATAELQQLIARSVEAMQHTWRLQHGIVVDEAELRALPADTKSITMPPFLADTLRAELPRFTALERLALVPRGLSQAWSGDAILAIAAVPTLRALAIQAGALTDADIAVLARLPLRELRLTGKLRMRSVAAFGRLQQLERLELDKLDVNLDLRALLASLPVLQQVVLMGDDAVSDAQFAALAMTKITRLELHGLNATVDRVAKLTTVPSLRELRLEGAPTLAIDAAFMTVLGTLRQLRKLELGVAVWFRPEPGIHFAGDSAVNSAKLRALLPSCEIVETPFGSSVQLPTVPRKN